MWWFSSKICSKFVKDQFLWIVKYTQYDHIENVYNIMPWFFFFQKRFKKKKLNKKLKKIKKKKLWAWCFWIFYHPNLFITFEEEKTGVLEFLIVSGKPNFLESVFFHCDIWCVTIFRKFLSLYIVHLIIFIKKNML